MDPWDSAEISVCEFLDVAELGTESNPILIRDDPALLGSASNPIVIYVDDDWCHDDADQLDSGDDTDIMSTPEFWASFTHDSLAVLADERADVGLVSVLPPAVPPARESPEESRTPDQSSVNRLCMDDKATMEKAIQDLEDYAVAAGFGDSRSSQAGKPMAHHSWQLFR